MAIQAFIPTIRLVGFAGLLLAFGVLTPRAAAETVAEVLPGHRWELSSLTLGGPNRQLTALFKKGGTFEGTLVVPPGDMLVATQAVSGEWHAVRSTLILKYNYVAGGISSPTEIPIDVDNISADRFDGLDKWSRLWQFRRLAP